MMILLFLFDKVTLAIFGTGLFSYCIVCCCACFRIFSTGRAWSTNIFKEIAIKELQKEYKDAEQERDDKVVEITRLTKAIHSPDNEIQR